MMIRLNINRCRLLMAFLIALLFAACGGDNNNNNNDQPASGLYLANIIPSDKSGDSHSTSPKKPEEAFDIDKLPQTKLMITANQSNTMEQAFKAFQIGLIDIIFTVIPSGLDKEFDIHLSKISHSDTNNPIPLDLTYLQNDQFLLLPAISLPAGTIRSITLSFSGKHSVIEFPDKKGQNVETYLIDPFFSSFSSGDSQTLGQRKTPSQLTQIIQVPLKEGETQYININIDKNLTAGLDSYEFTDTTTKTPTTHRYVQFVPTANITVVEKGTRMNLVNISKSSDSHDNQALTLDTLMTTTNTQSLHSTSLPLARSNPQAAESYAYMTARLSTGDTPILSDSSVELLDKAAIVKQYETNQAKEETDRVFFHYRYTFRPEDQHSSEGALPLKNTSKDTDKAIYLLKTPYRNDSDLTVGKLLIYTDPDKMAKAQDPIKAQEPVKALIFPLSGNNENNAKKFVIVETGIVDLKTFKEVPDVIETFDNIQVFNLFLGIKVNGEGAVIQILDIEGSYENKNFTATGPIRVVLLSQKLKNQIQFIILSWIDKISKEFNLNLDFMTSDP